ncbi:PEBP family protein [Dinoroseobacter sp. S124A]|uniref:PEBP family protein n=1 Tax=Dinoroseobacter sp. S124A TaxID=3415128 RepID=UPI003C7E8695
MIKPFSLMACLVACPPAYAAEPFFADIWADNWFEMRVNGVSVAEDSVPITTERSFNAESFGFEATRPFVIGLVAKDFIENDTGLEYIGSRRQQMGDGGVIAQITNGAGEVVAVSSAAWRCLVIHTAPLDKSCEAEPNPVAGEGACAFEISEEPAGWDAPGFDASDWAPATVYSARQVSPKGGYNRIDWHPDAAFVWGPDLEQSNTILCRGIVE